MVPKTSESARLARLMFHITTITSKINGCLLGTRWVHKMTTGSWSIWSIIFRKLYPVFDWQSFLALLNRFRAAFFSQVDNIFEKCIYIFIKDILMCLVLLIGSIKYLWFYG